MSSRIAILLALVILGIQARKLPEPAVPDQKAEYYEDRKEIMRGMMTRSVHASHHQLENKQDTLPADNQDAIVARHIVNQADWVPVATISTRQDIETFPAETLVSFSDGLQGNGTGIPYLFLTPMDFVAQDLAKDTRATLLFSLAQGDYCKKRQWDPMEHRCGRVYMTGRINPVMEETLQDTLVKNAFYVRHPKLAHVPPNHRFYFGKMDIMSIVLMYDYGGIKNVTVSDYLQPDGQEVAEGFKQLFQKYDPVSN